MALVRSAGVVRQIRAALEDGEDLAVARVCLPHGPISRGMVNMGFGPIGVALAERLARRSGAPARGAGPAELAASFPSRLEVVLAITNRRVRVFVLERGLVSAGATLVQAAAYAPAQVEELSVRPAHPPRLHVMFADGSRVRMEVPRLQGAAADVGNAFAALKS